MSEYAITAQGLWKQYRIGAPRPATSFREVVSTTFLKPVEFLRAAIQPRSSKLPAVKDHPNFWALRDVSFEVPHGEVLGVIGFNGAGKSTLLKILSRITRPTKGIATIRGRVGALLEVGTGFHGDLTGRENIRLNGAILGMTQNEINRKFDEIVAFAEVEQFLDTPVRHYSSGMYLRLAFAVAAHFQPDILIVDEVLAVGDAHFQKKCLGKMHDVSSSGRTVLFVSHNMNAVRSLCNRALWFESGSIKLDGEAAAVVHRYLESISVGQPVVIWEDISKAPGEQDIKLHRVQVSNPMTTADAPITVSDPLQVEVVYWNQRPNYRLSMTLTFYNIEGLCVFTGVAPLQAQPAGLLSQICQVPAHLLNVSTYWVEISVLHERTVLFTVTDVCSFNVVEAAAEPHPWLATWPGVLRPCLTWRSQVVEIESGK